MDLVEIIKVSISTLNTISVRGEEDVGSMLGVIQALKTVVKIMELPPETAEQKKPEEVSGAAPEEAVNGE